MFASLLCLIFFLCVVGVLLWGLNSLPFIDATIKSVIRVLVIVVVAIAVLYWIFDIFHGGGFAHSGLPKYLR